MIRKVSIALLANVSKWGRDESGNTTVDWVVVVAGIMAMTFVVMGSISGGVRTFGEKAETELATRELGF